MDSASEKPLSPAPAGGAAPAVPSRWLRAAVVLGAAPLAGGTGIFALWVLTRWDVLMPAGVIAMYAGCTAVAAGGVCLAIHLRRSSAGGASRRHLVRHALAVGALLLVNFPAAAGFTGAAIWIDTLYVVTVVNDSPEPVDSIVVSGGGVRTDFGAIPPGRRVKRSFHIECDGELTYTARRGTVRLGGTVDEYVTHTMGGRKVIVFRKDGRVDVKDAGG